MESYVCLSILTFEQRHNAWTPSPSSHWGNIFINVWCLLFLKTRCFLRILLSKSRWGKLTSPSVRYPIKPWHSERLPYRIHSASEVLQRGITSIISYVPGSANSQDYILVWGRTLAEHNEHLNKVLCISLACYIIWSCKSQPSNHENVITEVCK